MKKAIYYVINNLVVLFIILTSSLSGLACTDPLNISFISRPSCNSAPRLLTSESGVSYQLLRNGVNVGLPKIGTGLIIDFGTQDAGVYTVIATRGTCSLTMSSSVTVTNPHDGRSDVFGVDTWNVYGYGGSAFTTDSLVYYGYYTQTLPTDEGFDTGAAGGWGGLFSPSYSSTWKGCTLPSDDFTFIHKRKGFPCGKYTITMDEWDDKARVYVDGLLVWSCGVESNALLGRCSGVVGTFELHANSTIEVIVKENLVVARAKMSLERVANSTVFVLGNNNDSRSCKVTGDQWVDFFSNSGNRYIGSVRGTAASSNLGIVTLTVNVKPEASYVPACSNVDNLTAIMPRSWTINTVADANSTIVRLPYLPIEFQELQNTSSLSSNPFDVVQFPNQETLFLSRYSGPNQLNTDAVDNCIENGGDAGTIASIALSTGTGLGSSSAYYSDYSVSNYSELWLHGTSMFSALGTITPLFKVDCMNKIGVVEWNELNSSQTNSFILQYSETGHEWEVIKDQSYHNQQAEQPIKRLVIQPLNHGYYRLLETDANEEVQLFGPFVANCIQNEVEWVLYPNPVNEVFKLSFGHTTNVYSVNLYDASGAWIANIYEGGEVTELKLKVELPKGVYLVRVITDKRSENIKMLKD